MAEIYWQGDDSIEPADFNTAANWAGGVVPVAGDDILFSPQYNNACTTNTDQGSTGFGDVIIEEGFTADIGTVAEPLTCIPDKFEYNGQGVIHADLTTAAIPVIITNSAAFAAGKAGVNVNGSAITTLSIAGGSCAVGFGAGDIATVTTARVTGSGRLIIGNGTTLTNLDVISGTADLRAAAATVKVFGGRLLTAEAAAISTKLTAYAGDLVLSGSGTIADLLLDGTPSVDFTQSGIARTVTAFKNNGGTVKRDANVVTITTETVADRPATTSVTAL
jgi:hypothetical protein